MTRPRDLPDSAGMSLPAELLEVLVCPQSKAPLVYLEAEQSLYCPESRLRYRIDDGVPVMLVEEAEPVTDAEAERLDALARDPDPA